MPGCLLGMTSDGGDASFMPAGSKSLSGVVLEWSVATVSWLSGRQRFYAFSTAEAEIHAPLEAVTISRSTERIFRGVSPELQIRFGGQRDHFLLPARN